MKLLPSCLAVASLSLASTLFAVDDAKLQVKADAPGARINPAMWGIFFEDINFGADGGLYAELVKNGSFEFPDARIGWKRIGGKQPDEHVLFIQRNDAGPANRRYAEIHNEEGSAFGLSNEGFRGIGVREGESYDFSIDLRSNTAQPQKLKVELLGAKGPLASTVLEAKPGPWTTVKFTLKPSATEAKATLSLSAQGAGSLSLDRVSLFPQKTWKNRPQGLRADMVQALADLKPGFLRFPGGCIVEGHNLALRYQWKKTILPREEREVLINRWNTEIKDRQAPDYFQSFGLGFFEYFQLCEDLGAQPLPIINCGMACQFNSSELVPMDALDPYIQDALDLIEFANGPVSSTWGAKRAALGHPAPFGLKLLGVGNEQWGPQYVERFVAFQKALKARYPEVELIAAAGPSPADARFDQLWAQWRKVKPEYVDEHSYSLPQWFVDGFTRYDNYSRQDPKVFVGEYAAHTKDRKNSLEAALGEAVFMLGMERNADQVRMAAYAPLFAHVDAWQWKPDLIWVDNLRVMGTPSYYVQQLFSTNRGDRVLPLSLSGGEKGKLFASAALEEASGTMILKVVNLDSKPATVTIDLAGQPALKGVQRLVLSASSQDAENSLDAPRTVAPVQSDEPAFVPTQTLPANSLTVLRLRTR